MRQEDAARVVLVRAVEETLPQRIAPETLLEAHAAAGEPTDAPAWVVRRAAYLVDHVLGPFRGLLARSALALPGPGLTVGIAFVRGLVANYLGPSQRIHVVWNPIVVLIVWNLAVYVGLALHRVWGHGRAAASPEPPATPRAPGTTAFARYQPGLLERLALGGVFRWLLRARDHTAESIADVKDATAVGRRFSRLWWPLVRPALGLWLRRLIHLAAIGLAAGAILGMYVRGLFFAYRVTWESTFVTDPGVVALLLRVLLGPAALLLGQAPPGREDVLRLVTPEGDPAALWIHLYAVSALVFIVVPRAVLAYLTGRRLARAARDVPLDLDAPYFRDLLQRARAVSPEELEATVRGAVLQECRDFVGRLADFVCRELYDQRITPRLEAFREDGGTLRDLEAAVRRECEGFGPALERELPGAQRELERALVGRMRRLLGSDATLESQPARHLVGDVGAASSVAALALGDRVSGDLATLVAGVVSASVAIVVGTVSGGFGHALGTALLVGLVHSGPLAWLVGAVGGFVATVAVFWVGRDQLRDGLKAVPLPAAVLKLALWRGRWDALLADGRRRCDVAVREALAARMEPLSGTIADHVWHGLRALVGELQRPRVATEEPR